MDERVAVEKDSERMGRACVLMAKVPVPGKVKTRLVPYLGEETAAGLYTCFLQDMVSAVEASFPGLCRVAYTPAGAGELLRGVLPEGCQSIPQKGERLGDRLYNLFHYLLLSERLESVLAVGSDSPTLPMGLVAEAFDRLEEPRVDGVLGPAEDGGYYLVGLTRPHKHLFSDIPWSTPEVLSTTLKRAEEARLNVVLLDTWYDVDDGESLLRLWRELDGMGSGGRAPATRAYLNKLHAEGEFEPLFAPERDEG
jgi:rSAM/selenodomain-associated transferase 1